MPRKINLLLVSFFMILMPQIIYAKSNDPGERIGTAIIAMLVIVGFLALINWLKPKKK